MLLPDLEITTFFPKASSKSIASQDYFSLHLSEFSHRHGKSLLHAVVLRSNLSLFAILIICIINPKLAGIHLPIPIYKEQVNLDIETSTLLKI